MDLLSASKSIHSVLNETTELRKMILMETETAPPFFLAARDDDSATCFY
jgi:hypothetical protein